MEPLLEGLLRSLLWKDSIWTFPHQGKFEEVEAPFRKLPSEPPPSFREVTPGAFPVGRLAVKKVLDGTRFTAHAGSSTKTLSVQLCFESTVSKERTRWVLRRTWWVSFDAQIVGGKELNELFPQNSVRAKKLTELGVSNCTFETVYGPSPLLALQALVLLAARALNPRLSV